MYVKQQWNLNEISLDIIECQSSWEINECEGSVFRNICMSVKLYINMPLQFRHIRTESSSYDIHITLYICHCVRVLCI